MRFSSPRTTVLSLAKPLSSAVLRAAKVGSQSLAELVFPPVCLLCNEPTPSGVDFCRVCERAFSFCKLQMRGACSRCGIPGAFPPRRASTNPHLAAEHVAAEHLTTECLAAEHPAEPCRACRDKELHFDQVVALWAYQDRVRAAVVAAKYPQQAALGDALGRRLGGQVLEQLSMRLPDAVTFVPSHMARRISRGGVGTAVIASAVARTIQRPCRAFLKATRATSKQAWLDDEARLANVQGAFAIRNRYDLCRAPALPLEHVLIVDDVLTTGATSNEIARVLRECGVTRVTLAVVARAIGSR